ncbi:MAG: DUF1573 domain-containing protein [Candidatus Hydrogenedentota bacterium]
MRIRGSHILIACMLGIVAFVLLTVQFEPPEDAGADTGSLQPMQQDSDRRAQIAVDSEILDLGTVSNEERTHAKLTVRNTGQAPLELRGVKSSCACTIGEIPPESERIAPGDTGHIDIVFDPFRVPAFTSEKTVTIWSNGVANPTLTVTVKAAIEPEFEIDPPQIALGAVQKSALPVTKHMRLRQIQDAPVVLENVRMQDPTQTPGMNDLQLAFSRRPADTWETPGKAEYEIAVTVPEDVPPGELVRVFTLVTNVKRVPRLPRQVTAKVTAPYRIKPAYPAPVRLQPGHGPDQPPVEETITVYGAAPVRLVDLKAPAIVRARVSHDDEAGTATLHMRLRPGAPPGIVEEMLRFTVQTTQARFKERALLKALIMQRDASTSDTTKPTPE